MFEICLFLRANAAAAPTLSVFAVVVAGPPPTLLLAVECSTGAFKRHRAEISSETSAATAKTGESDGERRRR